MKNFTYLALSAAMTMLPFTGNAQTNAMQTDGIKKVTKMASRLLGMKRSGSVKKTDIAGVKFLPETVKQYSYVDDEELYVYTNHYTYDQYGNMLSDSTSTTVDMPKTTMKYTYDPVETSVMTSATQYRYKDQSATIPYSVQPMMRLDIVRDSKGLLTEFTEYQASGSNGALEAETKTSIGYGSDGKANQIEMTSYDEGSAVKLTFKNIVWEKYNGNLLKGYRKEGDYMLYDSENLIKSADVVMSEGPYSISGTLSATYTGDTKRELTISISMAEISFYYEKTDNNGSYTAYESANYLGEEPDAVGERVVYNENKDLVERTELEGSTIDNMEISSSTKYEYGYNSEDLLPAYSIVSEYIDNLGEYKKIYKLEYSDYKDITDGIRNTVVKGNEGAVSVYNAQGMYLGNSLDKASKGLNIVRMGEKNIKIMK